MGIIDKLIAHQQEIRDIAARNGALWGGARLCCMPLHTIGSATDVRSVTIRYPSPSSSTTTVPYRSVR